MSDKYDKHVVFQQIYRRTMQFAHLKVPKVRKHKLQLVIADNVRLQQ